MIHLIVYDSSNGDILRSVTCTFSDIEIQCSDGESYIVHERVDDSAFKVDTETLKIMPV